MENINHYHFNAFYKKNKRPLTNFIFQKTHNMLATEELVSDVFMKVYKNLEKFDESKATFKTWVYTIATNAVIDFMRKKQLNTLSYNNVFPKNNNGDTVEAFDYASTDIDPLEALVNSEMKKQIGEGMKLLEPVQAEMLTQLSLGYSYEDISDELNMPIGTVKSIVFHARAKMRNIFNKPVLA